MKTTQTTIPEITTRSLETTIRTIPETTTKITATIIIRTIPETTAKITPEITIRTTARETIRKDSNGLKRKTKEMKKVQGRYHTVPENFYLTNKGFIFQQQLKDLPHCPIQR